MMRRLGAVGGCRLGRADVHAPIQGHGIEQNNLCIQQSGQTQADLRLAGRRRTRQKPALLKEFGRKSHTRHFPVAGARAEGTREFRLENFDGSPQEWDSE